ncbi:ubinuclein-2 isoform X2 [Eleutherodactylus coqui]|uniref:ubinuclein-2 isoform X2 n=1 Tax=Eleutherodactylus coqui TaxID=57060 RepID=UPI003461CB82
MAEPRRVPFVSLSPVKPRETIGSLIVEQQRNPPSPAAGQRLQAARPALPGMQQRPPPPPQAPLPRPQREAATSSTTAREAAACPANSKAEDGRPSPGNTVRLELALSDPTEESCAEFSYRLLLQNERKGSRAAKEEAKLAPSSDPFNDEERERLEVERMAKKFEAKYYDELVPASLTTKYGGFYINTGTLQFRQTSDSEGEDFVENKKHKSSKVSKLKEDDRPLKKRKRKEETGEKEKPSRKLKVTKSMGVVAFNAHKPDKKKKKLYKDSMALAAMLQKFQKEKDAMRKSENKPNPPTVTVVSAPPKPNTAPVSNDLSDLTLGSDPVLAIFGGGSERELLQEAECALEMLGDFDLDKLLDSASNDSPAVSDQGENGNVVLSPNPVHVQAPKPVPPLPEGLPAQLEKRIDDLRVASKMFDEEGRKKFFTQEMNNILLDIELQLQELGPMNRSGVYAYIEAFVPCTKDTLVKRLKKLHLHIQDDRLKEPLQKLKTAISNVMPGQLNRYQEECQAHNQARNAKHQADDDRDRNPSEEEDEEKPGKRVMGPRKKFYWDDTIRNLLCNLVKIKLGCYELEPNKTQSAEDYLKNFMETEVKPLWPKGWMQSRTLFKESRSVHNHLTSAPAKKKVILVPKPKVKESSPKKEQKVSTPLSSVARTLSLNATPIGGPANSTCSETICLDDSLDEQLSFKTPSLDSISEALAVLNNGSGPSSSSRTETPTSRPKVTLREEKLASIMSKLPLGGPKKADTQHTTSLIAGHSTPVPKKPQDHATAHSTVVSGLIAGSCIQNPKVSLEPLPAKLLQQGLQRSLQAEVSSSSTPAKMKASSASQLKTACVASSTSPSSTSVPLTSSSHAQVSSSSSQMHNSSLQTVKVNPPIQQNYVTPLQATISKSHTNPVVRLTSSPQISSTSPIIKTPEKTVGYRLPSSPSPGSSQHTPVSRTAASSTSSNLMSKTVASHNSNPGFKSPYTMAPSPKPTPSPTSSSSCTPVPQTTPHHKLASGMNIGRPSPTVSPIPSARGTVVFQGVRNPSVPPKIPSTSPKLVSPVIRQPSSSPKMPISSPGPSPIPSPKLSSPPPKIQSQSPKPPNQHIKPPNPSPKSVNSTHPGPIKTTVPSSFLNVPISRANQNSNVSNRTHISGGAGSGALGATKQPMPHRQPSASGSPVTAATVQSAAASLLANAAPLTLMTSPLSVTNPNVTTAPLNPFGMLGGLVPVTMPFQFPLELLNFGSDTAGAVTSPGSTSAAFHHNLTQNLLKGLQSTATHTPTISHSTLAPHLQQGYTDATQSKGDSKLQRKNP